MTYTLGEAKQHLKWTESDLRESYRLIQRDHKREAKDIKCLKSEIVDWKKLVKKLQGGK
jgi:hypothetical protein